MKKVTVRLRTGDRLTVVNLSLLLSPTSRSGDLKKYSTPSPAAGAHPQSQAPVVVGGGKVVTDVRPLLEGWLWCPTGLTSELTGGVLTLGRLATQESFFPKGVLSLKLLVDIVRGRRGERERCVVI